MQKIFPKWLLNVHCCQPKSKDLFLRTANLAQNFDFAFISCLWYLQYNLKNLECLFAINWHCIELINQLSGSVLPFTSQVKSSGVRQRKIINISGKKYLQYIQTVLVCITYNWIWNYNFAISSKDPSLGITFSDALCLATSNWSKQFFIYM
jgi:hypothetical protein